MDVRREAVKAIVDIGTQRSLDPLVKAAGDNDPEIQIRATDGLVNFYVPGYVKTGLTASLRRAGSSIKAKIIDNDDLVIDPYIQVSSGSDRRAGPMSRAAAPVWKLVPTRRGRWAFCGAAQALPDLEKALRSKDSDLIYEALVAIEKIRDPSAGPAIAFLLHDLKEKVQVTAIEATGLVGEPRRYQRTARRPGPFPQHEGETRCTDGHGADARSRSCTASMSPISSQRRWSSRRRRPKAWDD